MTNKDAIKYLIQPFATSTSSYNEYLKQKEAYDLAIKALEERPKGKWIEVDVRNCHATLKCSVCDRVIEPSFTFGEYSYEDIKTFYPYCHCGADMRSTHEE